MKIKKDIASRAYNIFTSLEQGIIDNRADQLSEHFEFIKERVVYIEDYLNHLSTSDLIEDMKTSCKKLRLAVDALKDELDETFMIFIMGTGNIGKSSVVNALLREEHAKVNFKQCTMKIDVFKADDDDCIRLKYRNRDIKTFPRNQAVKIIDEEESKKRSKDKLVKDRFKLKRDKYKGDKEALKELEKAKLRELEKNKSNIEEVHWPVKRQHLLESCFIVDTPGLNQDLTLGNSEMDYYFKSDAALWVVDGNKLASKGSMASLEALDNQFEDKKNKIICVVNRIDNVRKTSGTEGVKRVMEEAYRLYGDHAKLILPLSAKEAMDGIKSNNQKLIDDSGILDLEKAIRNHFLKHAKSLKIESKLDGLQSKVNEFVIQVASYMNQLESKKRLYDSNRSEIEKRFDTLLSTSRTHLDSQIETYKRDVKSRIDDNLSKMIDMNPYRVERFIRDQVFMVSSFEAVLQEGINDELEAIKKLNNHFVKRVSFTDYQHLAIEDIHDLSIETVKVSRAIGIIDSRSYDMTLSQISVAAYTDAIIETLGSLVGSVTSFLGLGDVYIEGKKRKLKNKLNAQLEKMCKDNFGNLESQLSDLIKANMHDLLEAQRNVFSLKYCDLEEVVRMKDMITSNLSTREISIESITLRDYMGSVVKRSV